MESDNVRMEVGSVSVCSSSNYSRIEDLSMERRALKCSLQLNNILQDIHQLHQTVTENQLDNVPNSTTVHHPNDLHVIMSTAYRLQQTFSAQIKAPAIIESLVEFLIACQDTSNALYCAQIQTFHSLTRVTSQKASAVVEQMMNNLHEINGSNEIIGKMINKHSDCDARLRIMKIPSIRSVIDFIDDVVVEEASWLAHGFLTLVDTQILGCVTNAAGRVDSAQSTQTTDSGIHSHDSHKLPPIKSLHLTRTTPEELHLDEDSLNEKAHNMYSNFFELQYSIVMQVLESGGQHTSLINDHNAQQRIKGKEVTWADDKYQKNKRSIWKQHVTNVWSSFYTQFIDSIVQNPWIDQASMQNIRQFTGAISICLRAVPLPDYITKISVAQECLQVAVSERRFGKDLERCVSAVEEGKYVAGEGGWSTVGYQIKQLINTCDQSNKHKVMQLATWWVTCIGMQALTSFDMSKYMMLMFKDSTLCSPNTTQLMLQRLQSKVKWMTSATLEDHNFTATVSKNKMSVDYVEDLVTQILEPILQHSMLVQENERCVVLESTVTSVLHTWMHILLVCGQKLGASSASKLLHHLDRFTQLIICNEYFKQCDKQVVEECAVLATFREGLYSLTTQSRDSQKDVLQLVSVNNVSFEVLRHKRLTIRRFIPCITHANPSMSNRISHFPL